MSYVLWPGLDEVADAGVVDAVVVVADEGVVVADEGVVDADEGVVVADEGVVVADVVADVVAGVAAVVVANPSINVPPTKYDKTRPNNKIPKRNKAFVLKFIIYFI